MKIALSFRGKIGHSKGRDGHGDELNLNINFNHLKKYILDEYENVDIFIHSVSENIEKSKEKLEIFKPIYLEVEKQKNFGIEKDISLLEMGDEGTNGNTSGQKLRVISEKYSMYKCLSEVEKYEEENKFKYDYILLLRLDCIFLDYINLKNLDKKSIHVIPKLKIKNGKKYIKKLNYNKNLEGIADRGILYILNSNLLKESKYRDIFKFNFNDKNEDNIFHKIKNYNCFSTLYPIIKGNKIKPSISLDAYDLIRRVYFYGVYRFHKKLDKIVYSEPNDEIKKKIEQNNKYYKEGLLEKVKNHI